MASSVARSSRAAEGLLPHQRRPRSRPGADDDDDHQHGRRPPKRGLHLVHRPDRDLDARRPKKARIAAERALAKQTPADGGGGHGTAGADIKARLPRALPRSQPPLATGIGTGGSGGGSRPGRPTQSDAGAGGGPSEPDASLTKHRAKVINGIKHELGRLQPQPTGPREQQGGRKLRSQEATRFKSELSAYFPDYDEVIGNEAKEQHLLNPDTPIVVVDSAPGRRVAAPDPSSSATPYPPGQQPSQAAVDFPVRGYGDALFTDVLDAQRIDFRFLETQQNSKNLEDPLPDGLFEPVHRRAERVERSIRNSEKGRAQHEKDQIIRLLEGLQGHDWLRVMGVSGITETKKRAFEPARAHFIKGCQAILDKFRNWSLEEKRRKQEKERALLAEHAAEGGPRGRRGEADRARPGREAGHAAAEDASGASQDDASEASSPAQQLRQEAMARSQMAPGVGAAAGSAPTTTTTTTGSKRPRAAAAAAASRPPPPVRPPSPPREFRSFFGKKYERDGAVNRHHRRTGRKVLAWGHPIPDMAESDFVLPEEYRDEDTLKTRARKKRRDKRGRRP